MSCEIFPVNFPLGQLPTGGSSHVLPKLPGCGCGISHVSCPRCLSGVAVRTCDGCLTTCRSVLRFREKLAQISLNRYGEDLLFHIFYMNAGDVLQIMAAREL